MKRSRNSDVECDQCGDEFHPSQGRETTCKPCVERIETMFVELKSNLPKAIREIAPGDRVRCNACGKSGVIPTTPSDDSVNAHDRLFFTLARARAWHWQVSEACHDDMQLAQFEIIRGRKPVCHA